MPDSPAPLSALRQQPDVWREMSTGIFEFVPMPYLSLGEDDQYGGYSLTDGAGYLFVQGSVPELAALAHAWHAADSLAANPTPEAIEHARSTLYDAVAAYKVGARTARMATALVDIFQTIQETQVR